MSTPWWSDRSGTDPRPPPARGAGSRAAFGTTWWGKTWVDALERRAGLDSNRLSRGRGYARRGTVSDLKITTGVVRADVQGTRLKPYRVELHLRPFTPAQWDRVLEIINSQLGHVAALLDGELPPEAVADVAEAGLSLLPGPGDIRPSCSCPDVAVPCKHAAAVCYLIASELDRDPFGLLAVRGRGREAVLAALRELRAATVGEAAGRVETDEPGVPARDAFAAWAALSAPPPLPSAPLPPARPGRPAAIAVDPGLGLDADGLAALARDAAARAWAVLAEDAGTGLKLSREEDLARRAARLLGGPLLPGLAKAAGMTSNALASWGQAWRHAGADGMRVLTVRWAASSIEMADAEMALAAIDGASGSVRVSANRAVAGRLQLRLGEDGRWYLFRKTFNRWDLAAPPADDPATLLADG